MKVVFLNYLDTRELGEGVHQLLNPFYVRVFDGALRYDIVIQSTFATDFASVPRIPFAYLMFGGIGNYPAVAHDGGYSKSELVTVRCLETMALVDMPRLWWDKVFRAGLEARGVNAYKRNMMYAGVRLKGWQYFKVD